MLTFTHDGQTIEVHLEKLPLHEGMALQDETGWRLPEFVSAVQAGDVKALAALGWVLIKFRMNQPDLAFDEIAKGRVVITVADFDDPEARKAANGNGEVPPTAAAGAAKTRR